MFVALYPFSASCIHTILFHVILRVFFNTLLLFTMFHTLSLTYFISFIKTGCPSLWFAGLTGSLLETNMLSQTKRERVPMPVCEVNKYTCTVYGAFKSCRVKYLQCWYFSETAKLVDCQEIISCPF